MEERTARQAEARCEVLEEKCERFVLALQSLIGRLERGMIEVEAAALPPANLDAKAAAQWAELEAIGRKLRLRSARR
jgi:hypothetical protein